MMDKYKLVFACSRKYNGQQLFYFQCEVNKRMNSNVVTEICSKFGEVEYVGKFDEFEGELELRFGVYRGVLPEESTGFITVPEKKRKIDNSTHTGTKVTINNNSVNNITIDVNKRCSIYLLPLIPMNDLLDMVRVVENGERVRDLDRMVEMSKILCDRCHPSLKVWVTHFRDELIGRKAMGEKFREIFADVLEETIPN